MLNGINFFLEVIILEMGVHLPVDGWADSRIGQSLEINIS